MVVYAGLERAKAILCGSTFLASKFESGALKCLHVEN